ASGNRRTQNDEVDGKREQIVGLTGEVGNAITDCSVHDGVSAKCMRNRLAIPFEEKLIDAIVLIKQSKSRFEALGEGINRGNVQTLIVDALQFENEACF